MDSSGAAAESNNSQKMDNQVERKDDVPGQVNDDVKFPTASEPTEDEDVPEGFFDDFLKEDFMAGLDIIDEDNDEPDALTGSPKLPVDNAKGSSKGKLDSVKAETPKATNQRKAVVSKRKKSVDKRVVEADVLDIRRDPEKTRQAIAKDKRKSVKDKEKRLITDIVQTGLVPPGMELEVDINEVCLQSKSGNATIKGKPKPDISREKDEEQGKKRKRSSKESDKQKPTKLEKSRVRNRSPEAKGRTFSRSDHYRHSSPLREEWVRKLSPLRRNARRSPHYRKRSSSSRSPMHRRRSKSRSLSERRSFRRSRSRGWSPKYRRHRRDKSCSSERSPGRHRRSRPRKEEKMTFLEELAAKLNEKHPSTGYAPPMRNYQAHNMVPLVQPYPQYFNPPAPMPAMIQPTQYDENFLIGKAQMQPAVVNQFEENFPPKLPVPGIHGRSLHSAQVDAPIEDNLFSTEDIPKLFADRRIKLSDFLALTAKPSVSNTTAAKLQEKIKVIQRCQNAIKILNEKKFSGPLVVYRTASKANMQDATVSPLLRSIRHLPFTTPDMEDFPMDFRECCRMLLIKVGITRRPYGPKQVPLRKPSQTSSMPSEPLATSFCNPPSPAINSLGTQTDRESSSCRECLRRRSTPLTNSAVQTGSAVLTFSVSTQVSESDFYAMIPKTQSLASLTPAQLLGKQLVMDKARASRVGRLPSPPPAPFIRSQNSPYGSSLFNQAKLSQLMQPKSASEHAVFNGDRGRSGFQKRF